MIYSFRSKVSILNVVLLSLKLTPILKSISELSDLLNRGLIEITIFDWWEGGCNMFDGQNPFFTRTLWIYHRKREIELNGDILSFFNLSFILSVQVNYAFGGNPELASRYEPHSDSEVSEVLLIITNILYIFEF